MLFGDTRPRPPGGFAGRPGREKMWKTHGFPRTVWLTWWIIHIGKDIFLMWKKQWFTYEDVLSMISIVDFPHLFVNVETLGKWSLNHWGFLQPPANFWETNPVLMDTGFIPNFINHFGVKIRYSTASAGNSLRGVRMFRRRQPCYAGVPGERRAMCLVDTLGALLLRFGDSDSQTLLQKKVICG